MNRQNFIDKYPEVIDGIRNGGTDTNDAEGVQAADSDTALAILGEMVHKDQPDLYPGIPEGTDWEALKSDYLAIVQN